jgi:hypothetical protein
VPGLDLGRLAGAAVHGVAIVAARAPVHATIAHWSGPARPFEAAGSSGRPVSHGRNQVRSAFFNHPFLFVRRSKLACCTASPPPSYGARNRHGDGVDSRNPPAPSFTPSAI